MIKVVAFAGSARGNSYNKKLVAIAAAGAKSAEAAVTLIDLQDLPMPLFEQDDEDENGMPENAKKFKQALVESDGILISSPEYNSGYSALLKNCIDWASRSEVDNETPLIAFKGKVAALMSTSPGGLGGIRGLVVLRMLLGNLGIIVLPGQVAVASAMKAFNEDGNLIDEKQQQSIFNLGVELVDALQRFKD